MSDERIVEIRARHSHPRWGDCDACDLLERVAALEVERYDLIAEVTRWISCVEDSDRQRDALAARLAASEAALALADEMARLTTWGITVTDCREGCEHPACLILRSIAAYRKNRAAQAASSAEGE